MKCSLICIQDAERCYERKIPCNSIKFFVWDVAITIIVIILEDSLNHSIYMFFYCLWVRWWTGAGCPFGKKYRLCRRTLGLKKKTHSRVLVHQRSNGHKPGVLNWRYMKLHMETSKTYFIHYQTWVTRTKSNSLIT